MSTLTGFNESDITDVGEMIRTIVQSEIARINTTMLGKVTAISDNYVDVAPLLDIELLTGGSEQAPTIQGLPIAVLGGKNYSITPAVAVDDVGLIVTLSQDSQNYIHNKSTGIPFSTRHFNLQDSVFLPCLLAGGKALSEDTIISTKDDEIKVELKSGGDVNITTKGALNIKTDGDLKVEASGNANIKAQKATIEGNIELGGTGGKAVLTEDAVIIGNQGAPCKITFAGSTKTKAL